MINTDSKIYVAGHRGLVGSAVWRALERHGYTNLIGRSSGELDLINQQAVNDFFALQQPEYVVLAAAKVGGIAANNTYRGQFIYENTMIEMNVIHAAMQHKAKKLLFLGSSCIYPKHAAQPLKEEALLSGPLEPTNEPYAIAKISGIRLCDAYNRQYGTNFIAAMPTNMYGPGDNYHPENSHVLPALIRRMHLAREFERGGFDSLRRICRSEKGLVDKDLPQTELLAWLKENSIEKRAADSTPEAVRLACWGSGAPLREFLYSDDLAEACVFMLENVDYKDMAFVDKTGTVQSHINVGSGKEISIRQLAETVKDVVGYDGVIDWDTAKPDGTPRKLMDSSRLQSMGWTPKVDLREGIARAYQDFIRRTAPDAV